MPKKAKTPKPLPSALSVASPARFVAEPVEQLAPAKSGPQERKAAKPAEVKPKTKQPAERAPAIPAPAASARTAASPPKAASLAPTSSAPSQSTKVTFSYLDPHAREVFVSGDFNAWSTGSLPMSRQADGHWETSTVLRRGRYQYKFVVDGQWLPDPTSQETILNEHGTLNSVLVVQD